MLQFIQSRLRTGSRPVQLAGPLRPLWLLRPLYYYPPLNPRNTVLRIANDVKMTMIPIAA